MRSTSRGLRIAAAHLVAIAFAVPIFAQDTASVAGWTFAVEPYLGARPPGVLTGRRARAERALHRNLLWSTSSVTSSKKRPHGPHDARNDGGVGFRYLVARLLGLQVGLDVAKGPEEWATCVVFGSSW